MTDHAAPLKAGLLRRDRLLNRLALLFFIAAIFTGQILDGLSSDEPVATHQHQEQAHE